MYAPPPNNAYRQPPQMAGPGGYGLGSGPGPSNPNMHGGMNMGYGGMSPGMNQGMGPGGGGGSFGGGSGQGGGEGAGRGSHGGPGVSKTIFVANIPYDVTEEQVAAKFAEVGPVAEFVLKFDTNGRPKGYGFCHYHDHETALSAVRNLQEVQVAGRTLRVELSTDEPGPKRPRGTAIDRTGPGGGPGDRGLPPLMGLSGPGSSNGGFSPAGGPPRNRFDEPPSQQGQPAPPVRMDLLPPGQDLPRGVSATESISKVLAAIPQGKLEEILLSVKDMVHLNPGQARDLLSSHPQLAYALFQAMLLMNVVEPSVLQRIQPIPNPRAAPPPPASVPAPSYGNQNAQPPAPSYPPQQAQPQAQPPQNRYNAPPPQNYPNHNSAPPPAVPTPVQAQGYGQRNALPPQQGFQGAQNGYGAPPTMPPQHQQHQQPIQHQQQQQQQQQYSDPMQNPQVAAAMKSVPEEQKQMLLQVLQLTQQQVDALAPDQRAGVLQLRSQFGM